MVKIKSGVQFHHISFMYPEVMRILWIAQQQAPVGYEMTITSGCDSKHKANSAHYKGRAFDIRIRDLPEDASAQTWAKRIQASLGNNYFVLLETDHIHIQVNI